MWLLSLSSLFFCNETQKGVDLEGKEGWEELGRIEGGETINRIYYIRKESVFKKRKEINNEANYEFISVLYHHVLTIIPDANDKRLLSVHNMATVYPFDRPHFLICCIQIWLTLFP